MEYALLVFIAAHLVISPWSHLTPIPRIIIPFQMGYKASGAFTAWERMLYTLKINAYGILLYLLIFCGFVTYFYSKWGSLKMYTRFYKNL